MSLQGEYPPQKEGGGGIRVIKDKKTKDNIKTKNKITDKENQVYSKELRSRFGEAFLPFASILESTDAHQAQRKIRKKKQKTRTNQDYKYTEVQRIQK